jgi:hypothetical protein
VWIWETRGIRITDTIKWFPTKTHVPQATTADRIIAGLQDITNAIKTSKPYPTIAIDETTLTNTINDLHDALHRANKPNDAPSLRVLDANKKGTTSHGTQNNAPSCKSNNDQYTGPMTRSRAKQTPTRDHKQATANHADQHSFTDTPTNNNLQYAYHSTALNPDTGTTAEYYELSQCSDGHHWINSNANEIGRLAQGLGPNSQMPTGTDTLFFIKKTQIPPGRKATYLRIVCADRPEKPEPRRVRWTAGGDKVDYPFPTTTCTADLTTVKCHWNSVISTPNAKYMTGDLKDFYLGTPMQRYEYLRIPVKAIP